MKPLFIVALAIALSGCAAQSLTPVSSGGQERVERERPVILLIKAPESKSVPQQVIGDERPHLVLDGIS